jgi:hypothetical protein
VRAAWTLGILLAVAWGLLTWLFHNPFEGSVERLDRCIPATVGFAFRGSAEEVLDSAFLRDRVLGRDGVDLWLQEAGYGDGLRRLEEEQASINARLPGFLGGIDLRADFLGRETVVFGDLGTDPEGPPLRNFAVATRLSRKGRLVVAPLKHEWVRRRIEAASPVRITRYPLVYEVDLSGVATDPSVATVWAARVKDVLVAGNDRELVQESAHLAATGGLGSLPTTPYAVDLFSEEDGAPLRAFADVAGISEDRRSAGGATPGEALFALGGPAGLATLFLDPDAISSAAATFRFPSADDALLEVSAVRNDAPLPALPASLAEGTARPAADALREAAVLAPAESAILAARVEGRLEAVLKAWAGTLDADVRKELLRPAPQGGLDFEGFAREFDAYLERGLSVVVERLPDGDALPLDRFSPPEGEPFVLPLPGALVVLRQRPSAGERAAEGFLRRRIEGEWKGSLEGVEEMKDLPEGMRGIRFRPDFLTAEKALVRPAAAFEGDLVLLASNEGTLRRALECRAGKRPALSDDPDFAAALEACGEGQAVAVLGVRGLRAFVRDQRREAASADPSVNKDWVRERKRIMGEVVRGWMDGGQPIRPKDVEAETDRRVEEAMKVAQEDNFAKAIEAHHRRWEWLAEVRGAGAGLAWDTAGFRLRLPVLFAGRP